MQQPNKITEYLEAVRQQIRWKKAQFYVLEEIENHITDQKNAFIRDGFDEGAATDRAIAEMGDPIVVGEQLDRAHRPKPEWMLFALTAIMLLLGLAIQYFIGPAILDETWMFKKQVIWAGAAIIVMFAAYFADFTIIGKYPKVIFFVLCVITAVYYIFTARVNGRSIYAIYPLLMFPITFAGFVYGMRNKGYSGIVFCGAAFIIPACLSILVHSATVLFLLCISCLIILTSAILKGWFNVRKLDSLLIIYIPAFIVLTMSFLMMAGEGYGWRRMKVILNPLTDPSGAGYIGTVIHRLLSHSRFIGEGLPLSDFGYYSVSRILPAINTDFLLTYMIYRFGWIVLIGVIAIFLTFIIRAIILCKKQKNVLGFLVSLAVILTFALQFIVYVAANLGFLLFSPLTLPLITYGGRALITNMCLIGFLLSVFRTGDLVRDKAGSGVAVKKSKPFIQYGNGQVIVNLKIK